MQSVATAAFWIGLVCTPLSDAQRTELEVASGQGVVVSRVADNGPAAEAGLKTGDIILTVDYMPLADCQQLGRSVQAAGLEEDSLVLSVLRDGETVEATVTPQLREPAAADASVGETLPEPSPRVRARPPVGGGPRERARGILDQELDGLRQRRQALRQQMQQLEQQEQSLEAEEQERLEARDNLRLAVPADELLLIPHFGINSIGPLPEDVSITITRTGNAPTQVIVSRSEETWETTTDKLDVIPADLRPYVIGMLGPRAAMELMPQVMGQGAAMLPNSGDLQALREEMRRRLRGTVVDFEQTLDEKAESAEQQVETRLNDVIRRLEGVLRQVQEGLAPAEAAPPSPAPEAAAESETADENRGGDL